MLYLAIDPGQTTGFALVGKREGKVGVLEFGNVPWSSFYKWCGTWNAIVEPYVEPQERVAVVCEDYIQRPSKPGDNYIWKEQPTAKQVGYCLAHAHLLQTAQPEHGWLFYVQQPSLFRSGLKLAQIKELPSHSKTRRTDYLAAVGHAYYAAYNGLNPGKVIW